MTTTTKRKRLTAAEKRALEGCMSPGEAPCPAVTGKDSATAYQRLECRADVCRAANREYYRNYRQTSKSATAVNYRKQSKAAKRKKKAR